MKAGLQKHAAPRKQEPRLVSPPSTYHRGVKRREAEQLIRKLPREQQRLFQLLLELTGEQ